jgi:hypothetical protein
VVLPNSSFSENNGIHISQKTILSPLTHHSETMPLSQIILEDYFHRKLNIMNLITLNNLFKLQLYLKKTVIQRKVIFRLCSLCLRWMTEFISVLHCIFSSLLNREINILFLFWSDLLAPPIRGLFTWENAMSKHFKYWIWFPLSHH